MDTMSMVMNMQPSQGMNLVIAIGVVVAIIIIWNIQRDQTNKIDIKDLVCVDGKINSNKFMRFVAFIVSTWAFVYLIVDHRFSEWFFAGYMATWAGSALVSKWIDGKNGPPPPGKPDA